jgi:2,3-bisphosphoglycerate-dependent phosphoglycerate mutase
MPTLVLLRHGESAWNSTNRFTGWVDVPLTPRGEAQAWHAGELLRAAGLRPDAVHTSVLTRAVRTAALALDAAGWTGVDAHQHWRLNERCYGALQGLDRNHARIRYGDELFLRWRRSYAEAPPPVEPGSAYDTASSADYPDLPAADVPRTESLADVVARLLPYWYASVVPQLQQGQTVLLVGHGNSLRALVSHLDALTPSEVLALNIPTGMPLRYELDAHLVPLVRGGGYLEPAAAARAAAEVARQGQQQAQPAHGQ